MAVAAWNVAWSYCCIRRIMKTLREFLSEQPTNSVGANGYQRDATASGPVAGDDKKLFKGSDDLVTQDLSLIHI